MYKTINLELLSNPILIAVITIIFTKIIEKIFEEYHNYYNIKKYISRWTIFESNVALTEYNYDLRIQEYTDILNKFLDINHYYLVYNWKEFKNINNKIISLRKCIIALKYDKNNINKHFDELKIIHNELVKIVGTSDLLCN